MPPVFGFLHVAAVNDWEKIVDHQVHVRAESGLLGVCERLFVGIVGRPRAKTVLRHPKLEVVFQADALAACEFPTLECLRRFCMSQSCFVFYLHGKGVFSGTTNLNVQAWRTYLEYFNLENHGRCLAALKDADVCGVNWQLDPSPHFSGNFWWARSEYVRTLPPLDALNQADRQEAELWIGRKPGVRAVSLHQSNVNHYMDDYPPAAYRQNSWKELDTSALTVLTPVFLNCPERLQYLRQTFESFYRRHRFPGEIIHRVVDDRSPMHAVELEEVCAQFGASIIHRVDPSARRGFFDVFRTLVASVETDFFLYLEPDHYFYLDGDFLTPILTAFTRIPDLMGVYLRAPMTKTRFRKRGHQLVSTDGNRLDRFAIDSENSLWLGSGHLHEGFSLMPTVFRTKAMHEYLLRADFWIDAESPADLERFIDGDWGGKRRMGYLNAQAFCYHIGDVGGLGGGHTHVGDAEYEAVWSSKIL